MKAPAGWVGRVWTTVIVCGQKYTAYLFNEAKSAEEFKGSEGWCSGTQTAIAIDDTMSEARAQETLVHETLHGISDVTGLRHLLGTQLGLSQERVQDLEETIIRHLSPGIVATFTQSGWLKLPKLPKGKLRECTVEVTALASLSRASTTVCRCAR